MVWSWLASSTFATWVTAAIVFYYTLETARMRKQLVLQNHRAILPFIAIGFEGDEFKIKNIGIGPALNLTIDPLRVNDDFQMEVVFAIAPTLAAGEEDVMIYNTRVDGMPSSKRLSWGNTFFPRLTSKRRDLVLRFQTLDGRAYKQGVIIRPISSSARPVELLPVVVDKEGHKTLDTDLVS